MTQLAQSVVQAPTNPHPRVNQPVVPVVPKVKMEMGAPLLCWAEMHTNFRFWLSQAGLAM